MSSINNIHTVARYESKILLRSWTFRIFGILIFLIVSGINIPVLFSVNPMNWAFRSLPSTFIYNNFAILNIALSILAIFLVSGSFRQDRSLHTSIALMIRPLSNAEYVIGKVLGVAFVLFVFQILIIGFVLVLNIITGQLELRLVPLLWYFLLIILPSTVFIIGISVFLTQLIKNQAVAMLVLLGYAAGVLFFLKDKMFYLFDSFSFSIPLIYSDMAGFENLRSLILHRSIYFISGFGFIMFSGALFNRLPRSNRVKKAYKISGFSLWAVSLCFAYFYLHPEVKQAKVRKEIAFLSSKYFNKPAPNMTACDLEIEQGKILSAKACVSLKNRHFESLDTLIFSLNPGLRVIKVETGNTTLDFTRKSQILSVNLMEPLACGDSISLDISYAGSIDNTVCFTNEENDKSQGRLSHNFVRIGQSCGFNRPSYMLLTVENLWYPITGVRHDLLRPGLSRKEFTRFNLIVKTKRDMVAFSQGERTKIAPSTYQFKSGMPLPQISLITGAYIEDTLCVNDITYHLAYYKGHDYYATYFSEISDTLRYILPNLLQNYEGKMRMRYPYKHFSVIEVPVQFATSGQRWTNVSNQIQPQQILFPERGYNCWEADFQSMIEMRYSFQGMEESKESILCQILEGFFAHVFTSDPGRSHSGGSFSIFPNFVHFTNLVRSERFPFINNMLENYIKLSGEAPGTLSTRNGLSEIDASCLHLKEQSLNEIYSGNTNNETRQEVLKVKSAFFFTWLQKQAPHEDVEVYLLNFMGSNRFKEIPYRQFSEQLNEKFSCNTDSFLTEWLNEKEIPAYTSGGIEYYTGKADQKEYYLIKESITNHGKTNGLIKLTIPAGNSWVPGSRRIDDYIIEISAGTTKEVQIVLNDKPSVITYNTLISQNIPAKRILRIEGWKTIKNIPTVSSEKLIDFSASMHLKNEIIVDNLDSGFTVSNGNNSNSLRKFFTKGKKKKHVASMYNPSNVWSKAVDEGFYGKFEHSALFVAPGDVTNKASWMTPLRQEGYYDVYVYIFRQKHGGYFNPDNQDKNKKRSTSYTYHIFHGNKNTEIEAGLEALETGWFSLGRYYIPAGMAKIELSGNSDAPLIIADAVKWVLNENESK